MSVQMDLSSAARAVSGHVIGENVSFHGVSTDSRGVRPGELFVALRGERFDGHDFVATARERGAVAVMVDQPGAFAAGDRQQGQGVGMLAHLRARVPQHGQIAVPPLIGQREGGWVC